MVSREAIAPYIETLKAPGKAFHNVAENTIERILRHSDIWERRNREMLFDQGDFSNTLPLFIVLAGEFKVIHPYGKRDLQVAKDTPGDFCADVEFMVSRLPEFRVPGRGDITSKRTFSRLVCASLSGGKVLRIFPNDFLYEIDDPKFMRALARSLAMKMLMRSARADQPQSRKSQVLDFIRMAATKAAGEGSEQSVTLPGSLGDFSKEIGCSKQTVANALAESPELTHCNKRLTVPRSFWEG
jgi:hypothetical protein